MTHLREKEHKGPYRISCYRYEDHAGVGPCAVKHTAGGDFREATYRAVRQGLMEAESILLEPYYSFRLELPEKAGRACFG